MSTGVAKSPWKGALLALAGIAVVSAIAVVREWSLASWLMAVCGSVAMGVVSALSQHSENRRLDLAAEQAREMDSGAEIEPAPR
ncbi:hypothetical protein GCM10010168_71440 [Actinoplanes ianthinogenes]|uniref:Secreted protein n=1 Tax=Actinoplanes ianthinogenes TaxID=122358 RepID=A0ABM7M6R0_9ACTN|nr:hypothetical protein [Actinoplanes ianthinogenes]BCJ47267.1 hypothetical protein Aiant_79240 [Actinoplanes ianthinogenes]GGR42378.1 hypothetical protein GCM10010168_71440 [Actinoplanes ianthinogenes]